MTLLVASNVAIPARLNPTDLQLDGGQLVALIGPNGSGKTSLLRALAGVEPAATGTVLVDGEALATSALGRRPRLLTFLPASRETPWAISVRDIIALGLPSPESDRVAALLSLLELERLADRPINQLSTGERARALLARAVAPNPRVLLLDEPCSNLEPYWALRIMDILRGEAAGGTAVCLSLHDLALLPACDRVLMMSDGAIGADDHPDSVLASNDFAQLFRIARDAAGWRINPPEGLRSSP